MANIAKKPYCANDRQTAQGRGPAPDDHVNAGAAFATKPESRLARLGFLLQVYLFGCFYLRKYSILFGLISNFAEL
jgi:hypothetical protein